MEDDGGGALRRWDTSSRYSFSSAAEEVEETTSPRPVDDRVFVAVPEDVKHGKSTLLWALENLAKGGSCRVAIVHVHRPAQTIPMMGAKVHYRTLNQQLVSDYRKEVRAEADAKLDGYFLMCRRLKVSCDKMIIDNDDVAKGLQEFITLHGITKLVMGAAVDKHYSKKMKTPKSKTALKLMEAAATSCKIWFTCKGHLICTREADTAVPETHPSPAHTDASTSTENMSSQTRSVRIHHSESEASSSNQSPRNSSGRSRTEAAQCPSPRVISTLSRQFEPFELHSDGKPDVTPRTSVDSWDEFGRNSRRCWYGPSNDDAGTLYGSAMQYYMADPSDEKSSPPHELEKPGFDADIYNRLAEALREAQISKKEAYEESVKRQRIEQDLISNLQKAKELDTIYQREIRRVKMLNEILLRQAHEIEEIKIQHDAISNELHEVKEQNFVLEQRITEMTSVIKYHEEKMAANKYRVQVMQTENERLQQERDAAVAEAEDLRQKSDHNVSVSLPAEALTTEFSSFELEEATRGFDEALKIGEGGSGSVFKGFLRNTAVAVKLLHPESLPGQSNFNQEVAILSRMRHPNLVTLIGASREAFGLVYEFLPNGNLEDRLACTNNTPPLSWQVRTKIIYDVCSALIYLHSNKPHPVVHGDLKPSNILLDANFVSKLGDFGISQLLMQSTTTTTSCPCRVTTTNGSYGTLAYMDPELLSNGELTPMCDVYSLGIIILRLLTGQPPQNVAEVVKDAMASEELHAILDCTAGDWPFVQANQLAHVGLRCAEKSRRRRPDLAGEVWKVVEPLMKAASLTAGRQPSTLAAASPDDAHAPSYFVCPIFQEVMSDPHVAADGFTYEAEAVRGWFDTGHDTSPMTNLKLPHCELTPNRALRSAILEWHQQQ